MALALTHSPFYAGAAAFASAFAKLLMQIPAGLMADRWDRRRVMLWSQSGRLLIAIVLGLTMWFDLCSIGLLLAGIALEGVFAAAFEIAEFSIVPQIVPSHDLPEAIARNESRNFAATLAGRPLGGLLYSAGAGLPFLASALATLVSLFTLGVLGRRLCLVPAPRDAPSVKALERVKEGMTVLRHDLLLRRTVVVSGITNFLFQVTGLNLVVMAYQHHVPPEIIGVMLAASGAGGFLGALLAPWLLDRGKRQPGSTVLACVISWCVALWLLVFVTSPLVWSLAWALVGFTGSQISVMRARHQAASVPAGQLGRVAGFYQFLTQGAVLPVAVLFGGGAIEASSARTIAAAAAFVTLFLLLIIVARRWDEMRWDDIERHRQGTKSASKPEKTVAASSVPGDHEKHDRHANDPVGSRHGSVSRADGGPDPMGLQPAGLGDRS
ncbi:hypothetical protein GCM10010468_72750 [Actinocorallia longicatena]|uniref:MFS family arabinose efflux permease n=2 Tax=Actinocorallia longicatena TaxID=111803 RepID=A0ABP6QPD2_9ACTN